MSQGSPGQDVEPDLYLVQPGSMSGSVVEVDQRMSGKPAIMLGFVGDEVVKNYVKLGIGILSHNAVDEVEEVTSALAPVMGHLDLSCVHLKRSEGSRSPVPLVLVIMPPFRFYPPPHQVTCAPAHSTPVPLQIPSP